MLMLPWDITACPPKTLDISTTVTFAPPRPRSSAAASPEVPAPTTITSGDSLDRAGAGGNAVGALSSLVVFDVVGDEQPTSGKQTMHNAMARETVWRHIVSYPFHRLGLIPGASVAMFAGR